MANKNKDNERSPYVLFFPLLFFMLVGEIMHWPISIYSFRPDFTAVLLIYFAIYCPSRVNVGMAWFSGILLDFLSGAPIGINGLILATQVYCVVAYFKHFAEFKFWQQAIIIGIINFFVHIVVSWIEHLFGQTNLNVVYFWQTLATMLLWPIMATFYTLLWKLLNIHDYLEQKEENLI